MTAFEHGGLAKRANNHSQLTWYQQQHAPYEHAPHTEEMIHKITKPLQAYIGIEALHGCIIDVESQLRNGLLRCTREVEVFLLSSGRVS
jgi:membrane-associated PAP2 superfamily phosphatase